jgi:hypothetical protein
MNKFLYIDDNDPSLNEGIIADLNSVGKDNANPAGLIEVFFEVAQAWDKEVELLQSERYDGLHIRTLISTGAIQKDIPLLLCSATKNFKTIFARDQSSHNLFLSIHTKSEIANNAAQVVIEMNDLAEAFKQIQSNNFKKESLLLAPEKIRIDLRLQGELNSLVENEIPHNLVQFLVTEVINKPGPLINEYILAARLGIDIKKSEDWNNLLTQYLSAFEYRGILSSGWIRWWAEGLEQWWESEISASSLKSKSAKQRVKLLVERTGLKNLVHSEKDKFSFGTEFWTICVANKHPLDPIDGLRIIPKTPIQPWQEEQYISPHGLLDDGLEFLKNNNLRLNPLEQERWEKLKETSKK